MNLKNIKKHNPLLWLIWLLEGIVVGFGAILPGISGGTLCVSFGMYHPLIELLSDFRKGIKKHGFMLLVFLIGALIGFVGLSGLAAWFMEMSTSLVTCAFVGFIIGTIPELWQDAGKEKRNKSSFASMLICFVLMLIILTIMKTSVNIKVSPNIFGFLLCRLLWGLSFIVPGLSSSSLLLFFGLYQPMLDGISSFNLYVLLPMAAGMAACILLLSRVINLAYKKFYSAISHGVLGIVIATTIMIMPPLKVSFTQILLYIAVILCGAAASYFFTCMCSRLKSKNET